MSWRLHWWWSFKSPRKKIRRARYLGSAVDVVRVSLLTLEQRDVRDVLHWIGQSQKNLAFLERFQNPRSRSNYSKRHLYCEHLHVLWLINTFKIVSGTQRTESKEPRSVRKVAMSHSTLFNSRNACLWTLAQIATPHLLFIRYNHVLAMPDITAHCDLLMQSDKYTQRYSDHSLKPCALSATSGAFRKHSSHRASSQKDPMCTPLSCDSP